MSQLDRLTDYNGDQLFLSSGNSPLLQVPQENALQISRNSQVVKVVKPRKPRAPSKIICSCSHQEKPKRGRPRKNQCCDKSMGLTVAPSVVPQVPSSIIEHQTAFPAVVDQHLSLQNSLDEGPLRFSQLLAQDLQCSNQEVAQDPDSPMVMFHTPPALKDLQAQNSPVNLIQEAPVLSKRPRISEAGRMHEGSEQMEARVESSSREETIRAQIVACLLDPNFQDLLTKVEKVWRELEVSVSEDSRIVHTVLNYVKEPPPTGSQFWQHQIGKPVGISSKEALLRRLLKK